MSSSYSPTQVRELKKLLKKQWDVMGLTPTVDIKKGGLDMEGAPVFGLFYILENRVEIDGSMPLDQQVRTLFHELGHALMYRTGLNQAGISPEVHELIVENFANFMFENFVISNKK